MKNTPHLVSAILAFFVLAVTLIAFKDYAWSLEQQSIHALAPLDLEQARDGSVLQRTALLQPDLLLVYGSSELVYVHSPYESDEFFRNYPTGFATMEIAKAGTSSIIIAQEIAALGADLRGKKVVISITPPFRFTYGSLQDIEYAANFERAHAYDLIFSPYLSQGLKRAAARRMLDYPETLREDPFLKFALEVVADPSIWNQAAYFLLWPLGDIQTMIMQLQDHANVVTYLWTHYISSSPEKIPVNINWTAVLATAAAEQKMHSLNNPYGVEDTLWKEYQGELSHSISPGSLDNRYLNFIGGAKQWSDLQIVLGVLQELGAKPLILSRPMNVHLWEALGVSKAAQDSYYTILHALVAPYSIPVVDYRKYGTDIYFSVDLASHTSRKGWVYVDQTLDEFFHGHIH